jgi:hypothetical protein
VQIEDASPLALLTHELKGTKLVLHNSKKGLTLLTEF